MPKHPLKRAALMNDPRMASRRKQLMEGAEPKSARRNARWIANTWQRN